MKRSLKIKIVYTEAAIFGIFAGVGVGTLFGLAALFIIIPVAIFHIWCAILATELT